MKDLQSFFNNAFEYTFDINSQLLEKIKSEGHPDEIWRLYSHLILAQVIWLERILQMQPTVKDVWQALSQDEVIGLKEKNENQWTDFLLTNPDYESTIEYKNSRGEHFTNKLGDIMFHVINHGTHHRGQIATFLRQNGIIPDPMDYIFYIRGKLNPWNKAFTPIFSQH